MHGILMQNRNNADNQDSDDNRPPGTLETKLFRTLHDEARRRERKRYPWNNLCHGHAIDIVLGDVRTGARGKPNAWVDL
jgi:hypothetical protein